MVGVEEIDYVQPEVLLQPHNVTLRTMEHLDNIGIRENGVQILQLLPEDKGVDDVVLGTRADLHETEESCSSTSDPHIEERPSKRQRANEGGQAERQGATSDRTVERLRLHERFELFRCPASADLVVHNLAVDLMNVV